MSNGDKDVIAISPGNNPYELFPGYYPPSKDQRQDAYRRGLVSLDANALLDLYRFSKQARNEFFKVLETLRPRLFITHQAALEFHRNRLSVVESRLGAAEEKCKEIAQPLRTVTERIQEFANRYQIDQTERQRLVNLVDELTSTLTTSIRAAGAYDLNNVQVRDASDIVVKRLQKLLAGRIGDAFSDAEHKEAVKEALRRREERIPPGYSEKKLDPVLQAGDYLLWRQLVNESSVHKRPVLLVTNEQKEDWVLKGSSDQILGPRPELVLEMQREAGVQLHMVTVVGLLKEAPNYLGAAVSQSTIREAESLPDNRDQASIELSDRALRKYYMLSANEQIELISMLENIVNRLLEGQQPKEWSDARISRLGEDLYLLRWSSDGRATFLVRDFKSEHNATVRIIVRDITRKKLGTETMDVV